MPPIPQIKPVRLKELALPQETVLPNGVRLYRIPGARQGVVRFDVLVKGGYGVQEKPLQAMFVNRMLREGAGDFTAEEISRRLDYYGAGIDMYSSQGCNHLTLFALSKHFVPLLALLETIVKHPLFPEKNLETVKSNNKSYYAVNSRKVDVVSQRYFENSLWGEGHPLGHIVRPEDYDAITRDDLLSYYSKVYNSKNCTLFISGDADDAMLAEISKCFGTGEWGSGEAVADVEVAAPCQISGLRKTTVEGTMQSAVKLGFMALDSSHPDFFKFRFLTVLLGGYFGSRLMSNIREENGYTYHIAAELDAYGKRNAFMISSEADHDNIAPLLKEVYHELERIVNEPIPNEEVELVRNYISGELCREYEGHSAKSEVFINTWLSGEKFSFVNDYIKVVAEVSADELHEVARKYLNSGNMIEIIAGK